MKYILTFIFLLISSVGFAQTGKAVITNAGDSSSDIHTKVKWYSESIYYKYGVNIYRSEEGSQSWQKLNEIPIIKGSQIAAEAFSEDNNSRILKEITGEKSGTQLEGLIKLSVLIHSILNEKFALYLGLQFNDSTVEIGKTYTYRIMEVLVNGDERMISTTDPFTADYPKETLPPSDITLAVGEKHVGFTWKTEESRFFAVNVYRGTSPGGDKEKLNARPVMVTSSEDEQGNLSLPEYFFVDDSLESGKDYYYQLRSIDYFGKESAPSEELHVTTIDKTPPPAPRIGKIKGENVKELRWKQKTVEDLAGFNVYRSGMVDTIYFKVNDTLIASKAETWLIDYSKPGTYWYYVEAVDRSGNTSQSEQVLVSVPDDVPPEAPAGLEATIEPGVVKLNWSENKDRDLLGYLVFRALDKGGEPSFYPMFVQPQTETFYEQKFSQVNQEKYLYKIVALDTSYNQSPFSEVVSIRLPDKAPPEAPFLKDVYVENGLITIKWLPVPDGDVKEYALFRGENEDEFSSIISLSPQENRYSDKNINAGKRYQYYLVAIDSSGNFSGRSSVLSAEISTQEELSVDLKGKYNKRQREAEIRWKADNPDDVKGFVVYRSAGNGPLKPVTGLVKEMLFSDNQLQAGQHYQYEVRAYDYQGNSYKSKTFEIIVNE